MGKSSCTVTRQKIYCDYSGGDGEAWTRAVVVVNEEKFKPLSEDCYW